MTLIHLNGLGTDCKLGSDCITGQVCDASSKKCGDCEQGTKPDEQQEKCIPSTFYKKIQQPSNITLIPLNVFGTDCKLGSDCSTGQVCDVSSNKCGDCEQGTKPDEKQEKCISSIFKHFCQELTIKDNIITSDWPR